MQGVTVGIHIDVQGVDIAPHLCPRTRSARGVTHRDALDALGSIERVRYPEGQKCRHIVTGVHHSVSQRDFLGRRHLDHDHVRGVARAGDGTRGSDISYARSEGRELSGGVYGTDASQYLPVQRTGRHRLVDGVEARGQELDLAADLDRRGIWRNKKICEVIGKHRDDAVRITHPANVARRRHAARPRSEARE